MSAPSRWRFGLILPAAFDGPSPSFRALGWVSCPIMAIATLATLMLLAVWSGETRLTAGLEGRMTVELPATDNVIDQAIEIGQSVALLTDWPGIAAVEPIDRDAVEALLGPWFGGNVDLAGLPLPALIDVRIADGTHIDIATLSAALSEIVPEARIDDHSGWSADVLSMARTLKTSAWSILALAFSAFAAAVAGIGGDGLSRDRAGIILLHRLGADDRKIVGPVVWRCFTVTLAGAAVGTLMAMALSFWLAGAPGHLLTSSTPFENGTVFGGLVEPRWRHFLAVGSLPLLAAISAGVAVGAILFHRLRQLW